MSLPENDFFISSLVLHSSPLAQHNAHTDTHTTLRATSVAMGHIYVLCAGDAA